MCGYFCIEFINFMFNGESLTDYAILSILSYEIAHFWKSLMSVFQEFFASINKVLLLARRLGTRPSCYEV